jgi:ribose transport system substrate-binding protein
MKRIAAAAALYSMLAGCGGERNKIVAVIPKGTSHVFWQTVHAGANAAGREFDLTILWNGPPLETEYSRQIQIVDSMVARRVDGIVMAACDRKALVAPVERAVAAGIPVTVFDSGLDTDRYMSYVATNNYQAGELAARAMGELIGGKGKVAVVLHAPGSQSTMDRERGFEDAIAREFPGIRIVARQYGMADRSKAMAAAENMITANPDLDGMFASTEPSSTGAILALKGRGVAGRIKFVAFDFTDTMVDDLRAGNFHAMVVQDPFRMGYEAVKTVADKLRGGEPPKRMDLLPRVVKKEDLDKPDVKVLLFPDLKKYLGE